MPGTLRLRSALTFRSNQVTSPLLEAVQFVQQLNAERKRKVPGTAPLGFVPTRWNSYLRPIKRETKSTDAKENKGNKRSNGRAE